MPGQPRVPKVFVAFVLFSAVSWLTPTPGEAQVRFHDMVGANKIIPGWEEGATLLLGDVIQYNRTAVRWDTHHAVDPDSTPPGSPYPDYGAVWSRSRKFAYLRANHSVETVIGFGFTPTWATLATDNTWTWQGVTYKRINDGNGNMKLEYYHPGDANPYWTRTFPANATPLPIDDAHQQDYKWQWIYPVVRWVGYSQGSKPINKDDPYPAVEYFMIWNEGHSGGPFYFGSMKEYFEQIHLPAVEMLRLENNYRTTHGIDPKIVYGGWLGPQRLRELSGPPDPDLPELLDHFSQVTGTNLWNTIDVVDVHYRRLVDLEALRQEMADRGYGDKAIWQTESAAQPHDHSPDDVGFVSNYYARFARWALDHNPERNTDKYRLFYFPYYASDGNHNGYATLVAKDNDNSGFALTPQGVELQTIGQVLGGGELFLYDGPVTTDVSGLSFDLDKASQSIEAFRIETADTGSDRIVLAVHLTADHGGSVAITLPEVQTGEIVSVERLAPFDAPQTPWVFSNWFGGGVLIWASTTVHDDQGNPWGSSPRTNNRPRTFFVNVTVNG